MHLSVAEILCLLSPRKAITDHLIHLTYLELMERKVLCIEQSWQAAHSRDPELRLRRYVAPGPLAYSTPLKPHEQLFLDVFNGPDSCIYFHEYEGAVENRAGKRWTWSMRKKFHEDEYVFRNKFVYPQLSKEGLILSRFLSFRTDKGDQAVKDVRKAFQAHASHAHIAHEANDASTQSIVHYSTYAVLEELGGTFIEEVGGEAIGVLFEVIFEGI